MCRQLRAQRLAQSAHRASPNATEAPRSSANRARLLSTRARRLNMFMPRNLQGAETQTVTAAGTSQLQVSRQPCRRAGQVCQGLVHQRPQAIHLKASVSSPPRRPLRAAAGQEHVATGQVQFLR